MIFLIIYFAMLLFSVIFWPTCEICGKRLGDIEIEPLHCNTIWYCNSCHRVDNR